MQGHQERDSHDRGAGRLLIMLTFGIGLFVAGFIVAISGLSQAESTSTSGEPSSYSAIEQQDASPSGELLLLVGLVLSLSGVVFATAGPAAYFVHREKQRL